MLHHAVMSGVGAYGSSSRVYDADGPLIIFFDDGRLAEDSSEGFLVSTRCDSCLLIMFVVPFADRMMLARLQTSQRKVLVRGLTRMCIYTCVFVLLAVLHW